MSQEMTSYYEITSSSEKFALVEADNLEAIPEICEVMENQGFDLREIFSIPRLELGSFFKFTQIKSNFGILFEKKGD